MVVLVVVDVFAVNCTAVVFVVTACVRGVLGVLVVLVVLVGLVALLSWMSPHKSPPCGLQTSPGRSEKCLYVCTVREILHITCYH